MVSVAAARVALQAYRRQSFPVDPDDPEMQNKYREMRLKFCRVSPAMFMKFLETGKEEVKAGTRSTMICWAVPKANFPKGLPPKIKAAELAAEGEGSPTDVDHDMFYVIDQRVPREQLGKGVYTLSSFTGTVNSFVSSGASNSGAGQPRARGVGHGEPKAFGAGEPEEPAAATGAIQRRGKRLRENPADAFSPLGEETEKPSVKQARVVMETLQTLRTNIETARKSEVWVSSNRLVNNSVLFWVQQTVGALEEMVRDAGNDRSATQRIVFRFTCFFLQLAQDAECYPVWVQFKGLLPRLIEAGGGAFGQDR